MRSEYQRYRESESGRYGREQQGTQRGRRSMRGRETYDPEDREFGRRWDMGGRDDSRRERPGRLERDYGGGYGGGRDRGGRDDFSSERRDFGQRGPDRGEGSYRYRGGAEYRDSGYADRPGPERGYSDDDWGYGPQYDDDRRGYGDPRPRGRGEMSGDEYSEDYNEGYGGRSSYAFDQTQGRDRFSSIQDYEDRSHTSSDRSFRGTGPKGYSRSDEVICDDVCMRLEDASNVDPSEVTVEVKQGEVTLTGTVSDRWDKRTIEDIAYGVRGVKDVQNQLRVDPNQAGQIEVQQGWRSRGDGESEMNWSTSNNPQHQSQTR